MTLVQTYQAFLASPTAAQLDSEAAINYITTLTTVSGIDDILKHFAREQKLLQRKREHVLHVIESSNALCLEVETTIEFNHGGGSYLPGMDDNFLADQVVTLPIIHIVQFDAERKIQQVRISWDQGSMLKAAEVIGSRGNNWPIKDSKEHIRRIAKSAGSAPISEITQQMANTSVQGRGPSTSNPNAPLNLFAPRDPNAEPDVEQVKAPRAAASAAPAPSDYEELFVPQADIPDRSTSPSKGRGKVGAGKSFRESRILSPEDYESARDASPAKRANDKKYQHFEFSDGSDIPKGTKVEQPIHRSTRTKHASQWDFEDFVTPAKPGSRIRAQEQRNISWSDDEEGESPTARTPAVHQPRKDQQSQFELQDDGDAQDNSKPRGNARGLGSMNKDSALYKNLYDDEGVPATPKVADHGLANVKDRQKDFGAHWRMTDDATPRAGADLQSDPRAALQNPMSTVVDNKGRSKDFDAHFEIQDDGPILSEQQGNRQAANSHAKAVSTMQANWEATDVSPAAQRTGPASKENQKPTRRGPAQPSWSLGDVDQPEPVKKIYKTAGNGMGSRTGARGWGIGDDSADEEAGPEYHGRGRAAKKQADSWDF